MTLRALALGLALVACKAQPERPGAVGSPAADGGRSAATAAPAPVAPAPPPPSAAAILRSAAAVEPGGRVPLGDAETVIDPAATFELELAATSADARLVLLDAQDALVAATGARELGGTTRLTLAPEAPLRPGSRYALRVDGASTRELHDAAGRAYGPLVRPLLVAGTPPAPERKGPKKRGRR